MTSYAVGEMSVKVLPTFKKNLLPPFSDYCKNRGSTFLPTCGRIVSSVFRVDELGRRRFLRIEYNSNIEVFLDVALCRLVK